MANEAKRNNVMRKVAALLAKAASTDFDAERDALIEKADEMMAVYAIEQFELDMARPASERERPEARVMEVPYVSDYSVRYKLQTLFSALARHCGVMIGSQGFVGGGEYAYKLVGYRSDIDWLQMLYLNVQIHLLGRMEPRPDAKLSDVENFVMLRESGMEYKRIFQLMEWPWEGEDGDTNVGHGQLKGESAKKLRVMRKAYHDLCKAEGRQPVKGLKAETYRESFLNGYVERIDGRLRDMRRVRETATVGKGLVLASREDDLKEAFYDEFPNRRPHPTNCECETCHYMRCDDEKCTRPRCVEYNKNKNKPVRYRAPRDPKVDASAYNLGKTVAESADLSGREGKVSGSKGAIK